MRLPQTNARKKIPAEAQTSAGDLYIGKNAFGRHPPKERVIGAWINS
jgi:hypothetical protein